MFLILALDRLSKVLSWVGNFQFPWQFPSLITTFSKPTTKKQCFLQCFRCLSCFSSAVAKENLLKMPTIVLLANFQIFKFCCDVQGSHLIGYLWVSLIIDQSECLICYFFLHWINPLLHWINSLLHWITWKLHLS